MKNFKYITAPDLNTNSKDMDFIVQNFGKGSATRTSSGIKHGSGLTGYGIALTIKKALKGKIKGKICGVVGYGTVGRTVSKFLNEWGANVWVWDIDEKKKIPKPKSNN